MPGGTVSGEVCFAGAPAAGRSVLIMEQMGLRPERLAWTQDV